MKGLSADCDGEMPHIRPRARLGRGVGAGGHTWPGGRQYFGEDVVGRTSRAVDACEVIWEFFKGHARG